MARLPSPGGFAWRTGSGSEPATPNCCQGRCPKVLRAYFACCSRVQNLFHSVQLNVNNPHFLIMQGRITKVGIWGGWTCNQDSCFLGHSAHDEGHRAVCFLNTRLWRALGQDMDECKGMNNGGTARQPGALLGSLCMHGQQWTLDVLSGHCLIPKFSERKPQEAGAYTFPSGAGQ
jgi:hypothetical protein